MLILAACRADAPVAPPPTSTTTLTPTAAAVRGEELPTAEAILVAPEVVIEDAAMANEPADTATVVFAAPFEVRPDGFSFRNYGPGYPEGAFTVDDMREQFGDDVCSRVDRDTCIPTAEAQQWIDDRNADMLSGHCIGFTVTSYRLAVGELEPGAFTPSATVPYEIDQEPPIMRTIAANGSLYWVRSVWSSEVKGTPRDVLDALIALAQPVDLSIYLPGLVGGHSLLAYGVEQVGPQDYRILVYDNNFPGEERVVEVDYNANTWRYAEGAVNPNETAVPYVGDATTQTLSYIPLSAYDSVSCPVCSAKVDGDNSSEGTTLLSVLGQGDVLVKTALGVISSVAGEIINEIPGAQFIFQRGQFAGSDSPDIVLPAGTDYTVEFSGLERVSSLGPDWSFVVDQLNSAPETNVLEVVPVDQRLDFQAGGDQSPLVNVTIREGEDAYSVVLLGVTFADGEGLSVGAAADGKGLEFRPQSVDVKDATLLVTRLTAEDETLFATTTLSVKQGEGVALDITAWDGRGAMDLYTDGNGDGVYDDPPQTLPNEPLPQVLQESDAGEAATIIVSLSPYVDEQDREFILADLAAQGLTGAQLGRILRPLRPTNAELLRLIPTFSLSIPELGDLLFALQLQPERLETIISELDLSEEDERALLAYLADLALVRDIAADWLFRESDDLSLLVELLDEQGLTAVQLVLLLPQLELTPDDLAQVIVDLDLSTADRTLVAERLGVSLTGVQRQAPADVTRTTIITPTATVRATLTVTSPTPAATPTTVGTPRPTATPDAYPGVLPPPTGTPGAYPYPGPLPQPTRTPPPYPYPGPGSLPSPTAKPNPYPGPATPEFETTAFCDGNDLRLVVKEPGWRDIEIEIWSGEQLLAVGTIGPDGKPFEVVLSGPATWSDLSVRAPIAPLRVPLGSISCPAPQP